MYVRAIALALPLVLGIAACKTSSTQGSTGGQTASAEPPATSSPQAGQPGSTTGDMTPHADDQFVAGRVTRISSTSIAIQSEQGQEKVLELAPETLVTIGGQDARHLDLREGQEVRASYNNVEGRDVAVQIQAQPGGSTGTGTLDAPGTMQPSTPGSTGTLEPSTPGSTGTLEPSTPSTSPSTDPSTGSTGTTTDTK